jgi:hypothetical protein
VTGVQTCALPISRCERWNLSPIETRFEAIEEADRAFHGMKLRASTGSIALARLSEGLELVRIGAPLKPEYAAWRYGDQFGRRRRRHIAVLTGIIAATAAYAVVPWITAIPGAFLGAAGLSIAKDAALFVQRWRDKKIPRAAIRVEGDALLHLTASNIRCAALVPTGGGADWHLDVPHGPELPVAKRNLGRPTTCFEGMVTLSGPAALSALAAMLPVANRDGGSQRRVRDALEVISAVPDAGHLLRTASVNTETSWPHFHRRDGEKNLTALPPRIRLAMEMMLHETDEQRAMEGELKLLERRWRDAEEVAAIADSLTLPADMEARLTALRERAS